MTFLIKSEVCDTPVPIEARFISNEKRTALEFSVKNDNVWHHCEADVVLDFDLDETELLSVSIRSAVACDELSFRDFSLVKTQK